MANPDWPTAANDVQQNELFKAQLAHLAAVQADEAAADGRLEEAYYGAIRARLDQSTSAAEVVQRAAAAIGALYGAGLGVVFSVTDNPLPARGVVPLVFLGCAIAMSTVYLAWGGGAKPPAATAPPGEAPNALERGQRSIVLFAAVVTEFNQRRRRYLRGSILALALGLVLIPVPFVTIDTDGAAGTATATTSLPDWPDPAGVTTKAELARYRAELDETAAARAKAIEQAAQPKDAALLTITWLPEGTTAWLIIIGSVLGVLLLYVLIPR